MDFATFAENHRLRVRRDPCGDQIVPAKFGHLYEHGPGRFGIFLENPANGAGRSRALLSRRRKALDAGFGLHQQGECESVLQFDSTNSAQSRLAIRLIGAKIRRQATPAQIENLRKAREGLRIVEPLATGAVQA